MQSGAAHVEGDLHGGGILDCVNLRLSLRCGRPQQQLLSSCLLIAEATNFGVNRAFTFEKLVNM